MAQNISFNGATIYKPGSYSKFTIRNNGVFNLGATGIVAIIGEASSGTPGASEDITNNWFTAEQIGQIRDKYVSGPIVEACDYLFAPANDAAIPSGAQAVYIYKTNASTKASLEIETGNYGEIEALKYGTLGNNYTYKNVITPEISAQTTSSAAIDMTATPLDNDCAFDIHVDGSEKYTWTDAAAGAIATAADLQTSFDNVSNWTSPSGGTPLALPFSIVVTDTNPGAPDTEVSITIKMDDESSVPAVVTHKTDHSRTIELIDGLHTPLDVLNLTTGLLTPTDATSLITLKDISDGYEEEETIGGNVVLNIGYSDITKEAATVTVNSTQVILKVEGAEVATFTKSDYSTLSVLVDAIKLVSNWDASLTTSSYGTLSPSVLDECTDIGAISDSNKPARIKKDVYDVEYFFSQSSLVAFTEGTDIDQLPNEASETALSGGTAGATLSSAITSATNELKKVSVDEIVPLFSRDATSDITDGLTDASSTYTISAINQAIKTHIISMYATKKKYERQAICSIKDTYDNCKAQASTLNYGPIQLAFQDVKQIDSSGNLVWKQPWALACLLAGARAGSPIGTPLLNKYINCSGIRQTDQSMLTAEEDIVEGFDPLTEYDDAIIAGVTFLERPQSGGFRVVCDNTTFGGSSGEWVWSRGNVIYAANVFMKDFRTKLEEIYVGKKNTVSAAEVKSTCDTVLATYLSQGITVSSDDAPAGFKNLSVSISGNTIYIDVTVVLVEGIEYILNDFTIVRKISQT
jgi:hypothetical protein